MYVNRLGRNTSKVLTVLNEDLNLLRLWPGFSFR